MKLWYRLEILFKDMILFWIRVLNVLQHIKYYGNKLSKNVMMNFSVSIARTYKWNHLMNVFYVNNYLLICYWIKRVMILIHWIYATTLLNKNKMLFLKMFLWLIKKFLESYHILIWILFTKIKLNGTMVMKK